jgi:hypothetical protein
VFFMGLISSNIDIMSIKKEGNSTNEDFCPAPMKCNPISTKRLTGLVSSRASRPPMTNSNMTRALLLGFLFPAVFLLQACVPVATSVIAYDSAVSAQEHAAYTEYLFAALAENDSLWQSGKAPLPIFAEDKWRNDIYKMQLKYADYYSRQVSSNAPVHSFEVWKEVDYPAWVKQENENARTQGRAPSRRQ